MKQANVIILILIFVFLLLGCNRLQATSTIAHYNQQTTVKEDIKGDMCKAMDFEHEKTQMVTFFIENKDLIEELADCLLDYKAPDSQMIYGLFDESNGLIWSDGLRETLQIDDKPVQEKCSKLIASGDNFLDSISFGTEPDTSVPYCRFNKKVLDDCGYPEYLIALLHLKAGEARSEIHGGDLSELGGGWWLLFSFYDAPNVNN